MSTVGRWTIKGVMALVMGVFAVLTIAIVILVLPLLLVGAVVAAFLGVLVGIFPSHRPLSRVIPPASSQSS